MLAVTDKLFTMVHKYFIDQMFYLFQYNNTFWLPITILWAVRNLSAPDACTVAWNHHSWDFSHILCFNPLFLWEPAPLTLKYLLSDTPWSSHGLGTVGNPVAWDCFPTQGCFLSDSPLGFAVQWVLWEDAL